VPGVAIGIQLMAWGLLFLSRLSSHFVLTVVFCLFTYIGWEIPHHTTQQNESRWADDTMAVVKEADFSNTFTQGSKATPETRV
jgi:hypothetical protein